jgi:phenylalanyl-tRNA synthetase beta chain
MKYLKSWLQNYIVQELPEDALVVEMLNRKAFEVEEIVQTPLGSAFDIKVLPNRAHDALGHRGMARELCACFSYTFKDDVRAKKTEALFNSSVQTPSLSIVDGNACTRFMSVRIDGVSVTDSPKWLKERLESIGQRSINNIVDITNYVQFTLNKPMHAYDTRSITGTLSARFACDGETLTTLDDKILTLDSKTLVIADDEKVLGLAGIKGGKFSGILPDTTSVILESANFEPTLIRKTAQKYNLKTDASKRFENGIANSLVEDGLYMTIACILELYPEASVSAVADIYSVKDTQAIVTVTLDEINAIVGATYTKSEVEKTLTSLLFTFSEEKEGVYTVTVPEERLDIRIKEDIAEEIGRIIGYDTLAPTLPKLARTGLLHKRSYYENKIRELFLENSFSEVMTYVFGNEGEVELVQGLADDKEKLRTTLGAGVTNALTSGLYHAPLLGTKTIKIFEFGNVFTKEGEARHLAFALDDGGKKTNFSDEGDMILAGIKRTLLVSSLEYKAVSGKPYVVEIDFDTLISTLPEPTTYEAPTFASLPPTVYKTVSLYPFVTRDIAMWVPDTVTWESIRTLCGQVGNSLVVRIDLFDTFSKEIDGVRKTSYAFRLVFQSYEKTLTDEEVNKDMEAYYTLFKEKGFEVR